MFRTSPPTLHSFACVLLFFFIIPANTDEKEPAKKQKETKTEAKALELFDGKTLRGWKKTAFGGEGDVSVENKSILFEYGSPLTGITYTKKFPNTNYELSLEAKRIDGTDFFCGITFPVGKSHCSLILGGWGGATVGLSNIDGFDASENDTSQVISFKQNKWYKLRLKVTDKSITVWLDKKKIISQELADHKIDIRPEVYLSRPLGIASFATRAGFRNLKCKRIDGGNDKE